MRGAACSASMRRFQRNSETGNDLGDGYAVSVGEELHIYKGCANVHNLPQIFHYWSNRHLRPKLLAFGLSTLNSLFKKHLEDLWSEADNRRRRFVSLGAGNCDLEIEIALHLRAQGQTGFIIECIDLNSAMLDRGRVAATEAGIADQLEFVQGDLNAWNPAGEYDAAFANQSLHHVVNLEGLFDEVKRSLAPKGSFIISDMIGRNGHQRWPEALDIVHEFWRTLPPSYRFNHQLGFYDELYENWDCSLVGFEGIRAQDILPLLRDRFHFDLFIPFGNVIDPFVDRSFGPNFDAAEPWDRAFIDRVHDRDEQEIAYGRIKPTHMLAVVRKDPEASPMFPQHLSPQFCVRQGGSRESGSRSAGHSAYCWQSWPHGAQQQLEIAVRRLGESAFHLRQRTVWGLRQEEELSERTAWALQLEKELSERTAWALQLEKELSERTAWALRLEAELSERTAWALALDKEVADIAAQSLRCQQDLERQISRATQLEAELYHHIRHPFHSAIRLAFGVWNRLRNRLTRWPVRNRRAPGEI